MQDHPTARAASSIGSRLKAYAARFCREYGGCAVFGLLYGAVLYALMMSQQLTNTFDGLWHQNYHRAGAAELSSGRWVLAGIDRLLMGMHAEPIASIAALVLFIAGFLLVLDLFRLKRKSVCCLCLALFLSSTLISNTLSYRFTSIGYGFAYFFAVLSVYALVKIKNSGLAIGIAGVLLGLSLSCYQAYAAVFCVVAVFCVIFACRQAEQSAGGASAKSMLRCLLRIIFCLCVGAVFYIASLSLCLKLCGVALSGYNGIGQTSAGSLLAGLPRNLLKTYQYFYSYFFLNKLKINRLQPFGIFYILFAVLAVEVFVTAVRTWKVSKAQTLLLLLAAAVLPIAANAYMLLAGDKLELQMTAGLAMVAPLTMALVFSCPERKRTLKLACALLCAALTYGSAMQVWIDQEGMYEGQNACETMMTQVIHDLRGEDLLSADHEYFFIGVPEENPLFSTSEAYTRANAYAQMGRFWVSGNCSQMSYGGLLQRMGLGLSMSSLQYEDIAGNINASELPAFPSAGYIVQLDENTVVIKISEYKTYTGDSKYVIDSPA